LIPALSIPPFGRKQSLVTGIAQQQNFCNVLRVEYKVCARGFTTLIDVAEIANEEAIAGGTPRNQMSEVPLPKT
jgi:hypothetical protein